MADHSYYNRSPTDDGIHNASPQQSTPERIRHLPEWEVPQHPPKRRRRGSDSIFSKLLRVPTNINLPSPTLSIPDAFKRHQMTFTTRPKKRRSTPINKNAISSPFGFTHTKTGTPSPVASMSRLQRETTRSPTESGTILPMHNAGPRYANNNNNSNVVSPNALSTFTPSPPTTRSQTPQNHQPGAQYEAPQQQTHEGEEANTNASRSLRQSLLSPTLLFPRLRNQISSTVNSLLPNSPPPPDAGSHNHRANTPNRYHSPKSLGFMRSSPGNTNRNTNQSKTQTRGRGSTVVAPNKPLPPTPPGHELNPTALESGHGYGFGTGNGNGYGTSKSRRSEKPPFPMNLPPHRRRMLYFIIPIISAILLLALILGLGLGLGLRNRFENTNRLGDGRGGASGDDLDGGIGTGTGTGNETPSSTLGTIFPSTNPIPTSPSSTSSSLSITNFITSTSTPPINTSSPKPSPTTSTSPMTTTTSSNTPTTDSSSSAIPSNTPGTSIPSSSSSNSPPTPIYPSSASTTGSNPNSSPKTPGATPTPTPSQSPTTPSPSSATDPLTPSPQPSQLPRPLPLPPPWSTNPGPFKGNLLSYNATGVGACGVENQASDLIVGLAWEVFDAGLAISGGGGTDQSANAYNGGCMAASGGGGGGSGGGGGGAGGAGGSGGAGFQGSCGNGNGYGNGNGNGNGSGGSSTPLPPPPSGNPNENILCGRKIRVWLEHDTRSTTTTTAAAAVIVKVVDRCTSCNEPTDLGLSTGVFKALGDEQAIREGKARGVWEWV